LGKNEVWDRGEAYFYILSKLPSLQDRLQIWQFKAQYPDTLSRAKSYIDDLTAIYEVITKNPVFMTMLSYFLAIGNVLNGGTNKG